MALLFTSPKWLQGARLKQCINTLKSQGRLNNVFVDEAHCVDFWAGSFRAAYSQLGFLKHQLGIPVTALSGSASKHTVKVITESVNLDKPTITKMSFYRPNLSICVIKRAMKPIAQMVNIVTGKFKESSGIVYCNKRTTTKDAAHALKNAGINDVFIDGDLDNTERRQSESKWTEAGPDGCNGSCCYCQIVKSEFKNYANRKKINHGKKFRFVNYIRSKLIKNCMYLLALV